MDPATIQLLVSILLPIIAQCIESKRTSRESMTAYVRMPRRADCLMVAVQSGCPSPIQAARWLHSRAMQLSEEEAADLVSFALEEPLDHPTA